MLPDAVSALSPTTPTIQTPQYTNAEILTALEQLERKILPEQGMLDMLIDGKYVTVVTEQAKRALSSELRELESDSRLIERLRTQYKSDTKTEETLRDQLAKDKATHGGWWHQKLTSAADLKEESLKLRQKAERLLTCETGNAALKQRIDKAESADLKEMSATLNSYVQLASGNFVHVSELGKQVMENIRAGTTPETTVAVVAASSLAAAEIVPPVIERLEIAGNRPAQINELLQAGNLDDARVLLLKMKGQPPADYLACAQALAKKYAANQESDSIPGFLAEVKPRLGDAFVELLRTTCTALYPRNKSEVAYSLLKENSAIQNPKMGAIAQEFVQNAIEADETTVAHKIIALFHDRMDPKEVVTALLAVNKQTGTEEYPEFEKLVARVVPVIGDNAGELVKGLCDELISADENEKALEVLETYQAHMQPAVIAALVTEVFNKEFNNDNFQVCIDTLSTFHSQLAPADLRKMVVDLGENVDEETLPNFFSLLPEVKNTLKDEFSATVQDVHTEMLSQDELINARTLIDETCDALEDNVVALILSEQVSAYITEDGDIGDVISFVRDYAVNMPPQTLTDSLQHVFDSSDQDNFEDVRALIVETAPLLREKLAEVIEHCCSVLKDNDDFADALTLLEDNRILLGVKAGELALTLANAAIESSYDCNAEARDILITLADQIAPKELSDCVGDLCISFIKNSENGEKEAVNLLNRFSITLADHLESLGKDIVDQLIESQKYSELQRLGSLLSDKIGLAATTAVRAEVESLVREGKRKEAQELRESFEV